MELELQVARDGAARHLRARMETNEEQLSELMRRYASGDDAVFDALYQEMAPRLYRFCLRLSTARSEADDLLQETMLRVHRARATYLTGCNALHWAFAIARSAHLDRLRRRRRRPEELGVAGDAAEQDARADGSDLPQAAALARELIGVVTVELARMSESNRAAYVLLKEEGLSVKAAAAVLGTSEAAVRQRVHRAYERLRIAMGAAGWEEVVHDAVEHAVPVPV